MDSVKDINKDELVKIGKWKLIRKQLAEVEDDQIAKTRLRMTFTTRSKGKLRRAGSEDDEPQHLGGMRNPGKAVASIPGYREAGAKIYSVLVHALEQQPGLLQRCCDAIGSEEEDAGPTQEDLLPVRRSLNELYGELEHYKVSLALDTELQAGLIWRLSRSMGDPDADEIYRWLTEGAPAGIEQLVTDPAGIFPASHEDGETENSEDLVDHERHQNYTSVDEYPMAEPEVMRLISTGFVWATESYEEFCSKIGGRPHFSKLGMITKEKDNKIKRRLILDCKESGVNRKAVKGGRLTLPRATDAVDDALQLMRRAMGQQSVEWLVLDFTDWFFNIPLRPTERKHFTMKYKNKYIVYLTQAQGSVNAPIVCGRVAALVSRMTQGVMGLHIMRLQLYVDDPCLCVVRER